jgi:hypothetical protein
MGKLTPKQIDSFNEPKTHEDGDGLRLVVKADGNKYWILRFQPAGKRREMGLGSYPNVKLKQARERERLRNDDFFNRKSIHWLLEQKARQHFSKRSKRHWQKRQPSRLWPKSTLQLTAQAGKTSNMVSNGRTPYKPMLTQFSES